MCGWGGIEGGGRLILWHTPSVKPVCEASREHKALSPTDPATRALEIELARRVYIQIDASFWVNYSPCCQVVNNSF